MNIRNCLVVVLLHGFVSASADMSRNPLSSRKVCVWSNPGFWMNLTMTQIENKSWQVDGKPIIDCVYIMCGSSFNVSGEEVTIVMNETIYEQTCAKDVARMQALGVEVHQFLTYVPPQLYANPRPAIESAVRLAKKYGWKGYNIDDESECAPRADLYNFTAWVHGLEGFQEGLVSEGLELSVDVQAIWGILPGPYKRHSPCQKAPWDFKISPELTKLVANSKIMRWVSMDTYFPQSGRFEGQVDWWTKLVGGDRFSAGISGGYTWENNTDAFVGRMRSVWDRNVGQFAFWMGVIKEEWGPWLYRWKTGCLNCPNAQVDGIDLACFEMQADCGEKDMRPIPATRLIV